MEMALRIPKEIKNYQILVGTTPAAVLELTKYKHMVYVQ